ncbi:related to p53-related protein kinase [Melanopsichium pennsylvanicum]|uniref:non-specific serine/threonine protein kinase n=1 Tax=Melanopsichium pennsylvanicum TaxID=63383 RepID=A0AAJ4XG11_9BASI|nr:related to p53-related protein kinase [Melanopsichium pennsylvanicum]
MSGTDGSSTSPSLSRTPRLAFPTTRSRPTSVVDSVEATTEALLSTSPASSITSMGASPRKHTQSAVDRLASAQARDAAATAKSHRTRTTSSTSRSSTEGGRPNLPSLLQATTSRSAATPVASTSLETSPTGKFEGASHRASVTSPHVEGKGASQGGHTMSRSGSTDQRSAATETKVAGPSSTFSSKKSSAGSTPKRNPTAPPLVALLSDSSASKLIKQGAEAKVYSSHLATNNILSWPQPRSSNLASAKVEAPASILLKWRFPKTYRHPILSGNITASRTIMEARALLRCAKAGVAVPAVKCVDEKEGILGLELIPGRSVREWLGGGAEGEDEQIVDEEAAAAAEQDEAVLSENDQVKLMRLIGKQLAIMHEAGIIHGDLTTSNMMLRPASPPSSANEPVKVDLEKDEVVLIDFGLSSVSSFAEDKAVDLYVLERAFASTHPSSERLYQTILESYSEEVTQRSKGKAKGKGGKLDKWEETRRKLEEVATTLLSFRPTHALELLPLPFSSQSRSVDKGGIDGDDWQSLASRMDTELDHIGSAKLLASHTPHKSCVRTAPVEGKPIWTLSLVPLRTVLFDKVPFAILGERIVNDALTGALEAMDRWLVPFRSVPAPLGMKGKSKTE